jgi:hypothetical protein
LLISVSTAWAQSSGEGKKGKKRSIFLFSCIFPREREGATKRHSKARYSFFLFFFSSFLYVVQKSSSF